MMKVNNQNEEQIQTGNLIYTHLGRKGFLCLEDLSDLVESLLEIITHLPYILLRNKLEEASSQSFVLRVSKQKLFMLYFN